jgi:hypothetical protein
MFLIWAFNVGGSVLSGVMTAAADRIPDLVDELAVAVEEVVSTGAQRASTDDDLLGILSAAARAGRVAEALIVDGVGHVLDRSGPSESGERMTGRYGCGNVTELVQRVTRVSRRKAVEVIAAAKAVAQPMGLSSGVVLPAELPAMRDAMAAGEVGAEAIVAVAAPLRRMGSGVDSVAAADAELAAAACGTGADGAPPASVEDLRQMATVWSLYLDPDGAEPREARAMRARGLTLGRAHDGVVPVRGNLLPEVAGLLEREFAALLNPKVDGVPVTGVQFAPLDETGRRTDEDPDRRTRAQKQHDAFAIILTKATSSLPTLGGAAPTLVVTVREEDLLANRGYAHVDGTDQPVSLSVARHVACTGTIQRVVMNDKGRIVELGTLDRIFTHVQRKAFTARDGNCLIPGCHVPAAWCEIHHIPDYAQGGPTHTDHGVPLCWFHHRSLDKRVWQIRIRNGIPEVKGPYWWDPEERWRPVTTSPTRMLDKVARGH